MALYITPGAFCSLPRSTEWYIGEPLQKFTERVYIFQAGGDELQVIITALSKAVKRSDTDRRR